MKPKRWIDPYKEANANGVALKTGQKTFQQICAENGRDWKKVIEEMAEAKEYAKAQGIDLMAMLAGASVHSGIKEGEEHEEATE